MNTERVLVTDTDAHMKATEALKRGGVILYPTDTVYGLGADATNTDAVRTIQKIKGRDETKSFLVMVSDKEMLETYAHMNILARTLTHMFLPGPLTLVMNVRDRALAPVMNADMSVGFRIPDNETCIALVRALGKPIVSTSANHSGSVQPRTLDGMLAQFGEEADYVDVVLDGGPSTSALPSTIIDARSDKAVLLREGAIKKELLTSFLF